MSSNYRGVFEASGIGELANVTRTLFEADEAAPAAGGAEPAPESVAADAPAPLPGNPPPTQAEMTPPPGVSVDQPPTGDAGGAAPADAGAPHTGDAGATPPPADAQPMDASATPSATDPNAPPPADAGMAQPAAEPAPTGDWLADDLSAPKTFARSVKAMLTKNNYDVVAVRLNIADKGLRLIVREKGGDGKEAHFNIIEKPEGFVGSITERKGMNEVAWVREPMPLDSWSVENAATEVLDALASEGGNAPNA